MANIVPTQTLNFSDYLGELEKYKYNPSLIINAVLNRLSDAYEGKIDVVDASNPFIYLLETLILNSTNAINEYTNLTRKLYPRLANTREDLYLHMSDYDYLGIFSEPALANVTVNVLYSDFISKAVYDPSIKAYIFKIPKHYTVTVENFTFTFLYPVVIRKYENDTLSVRFIKDEEMEIQRLTTDYIDYNITRQFNGESWISFNVPVVQTKIISTEIPVEKAKLFEEVIEYSSTEKYYYAKVYYYANNKWNPMLVTHNYYIYDINTPTATIKVLQDQNRVIVSIPTIYVLNDRIGTKVRIDIFTTNGYIDINFGDKQINDFKLEYNPVDPDKDLDIYTSPLNTITKIMYISQRVIGGRDQINFDTLKKNVIDNSIGDRLLPVTNKQLEFLSNENNFKLIKDVDIVTNRIFYLQTLIPNAPTRYPVSKLDLGMLEFVSSLEDMLASNVVKEFNNHLYVIKENTIFKHDNGYLTIIDESEVNNLRAISGDELITSVNNVKYLSSVYHYIIDTKDNTPTLRAYDLSLATVTNIDFKEYNETTGVNLNTRAANLYKTESGYSLDVLTVYKNLSGQPVPNITPYLVYKVGNTKYFLRGFLINSIDDSNIVYRYYLNTQYDIDADSNLTIDNFTDESNNTFKVTLNLKSDLYQIYTLDQKPTGYIPKEYDSLIDSTYIAFNTAIVTTEVLNLSFGEYLKRLNSRLHISTDVQTYQTYQSDIPLTYESDVYDLNGQEVNIPYVDANGNLLTTLKHQRGDIVYNTNNEMIYKHRRGDIVLDENNRPIPNSLKKITLHSRLLFNDYRINLSTVDDTINYFKFVKNKISNLCIYNANEINDILLENTASYVTVPEAIGYTKAIINSTQYYLNPAIEFIINVYVSNAVYLDVDLRENINYTIVKTIDNYLDRTKISKSELTSILHTTLNEFIKNINIGPLTTYNAEYIEILDESSKLTLKKKLIRTANNGYNLVEDILINYINVDVK